MEIQAVNTLQMKGYYRNKVSLGKLEDYVTKALITECHNDETKCKMKARTSFKRRTFQWMNAWHKGYLNLNAKMWNSWNTAVLLCSLILLNIPSFVLSTSSCPQQCYCVSNRFPGFTVECIRRQLSRLPSIPEHTVHLKLSDNSISYIRNSTLMKFSSLITLFLDHNSISHIESGAFKNVPKVQVLNLRKNKLTTLDPFVFSHLRYLELLDLGENNIMLLYAETFVDNSLLIRLSIDTNSLSAIANTSFHTLHNLKGLSLHRNPVKRLHPEVFHSQHSLIELNLSNMELEDIHADLFRNQESLKVLDLANNKLVTLLPKPFKHLAQLTYLNISGNPINCDCKVLPLQSWLIDQPRLHWDSGNKPKCYTPDDAEDMTIFEFPSENMTCSRHQSITGNVVRKKHKPAVDPNKSLLGPLIYDPMMGWYTASTLTGMLVLFLICVALDKLKRKFYKWRRMKRKLKEQHQYEFCGEKPHLDGEYIGLKTFNRIIPPRQSSRDSTRTHRSTQSAPIGNSVDVLKSKLTHQTSFDSRVLRYPPPKQRQQSQDSQSSQDSSRLLPLLQHSQLIRQPSSDSYWAGQSSFDSGSMTRQSSQESGPSIRPLSIHGQFIRAASFDARSRTASVDHTGTDVSAIPFRLGIHGHLMRASSFDARAIMRQPSIDGGQVLKAYSQEAFRRQFSIDSNDSLSRQSSFDATKLEKSNLKPSSGLSQSHDSPLGKSQLFGPVFIKQKISDPAIRRQSSVSPIPKVPIARPEILPIKAHSDGVPLPRARPVSPLVRQESQGTHLKQPQSPLLQQALKSPLMKQRSHDSPFLQVQPRRSSLVRQRSHELPLHPRPVSPLAQPPRDLSFPQSCHEELQIKTTPSGNTLTVSPLRHHMTPPTSPGVNYHPDFSANSLMVPHRPPSSPIPRSKRPSQDSLPSMALHLPEIIIQVFDHSDPTPEHNDLTKTNSVP